MTSSNDPTRSERFIVGYTGYRREKEPLVIINEDIIAPSMGYGGWHSGKGSRRIGVNSIHKSSISVRENEHYLNKEFLGADVPPTLKFVKNNNSNEINQIPSINSNHDIHKSKIFTESNMVHESKLSIIIDNEVSNGSVASISQSTISKIPMVGYAGSYRGKINGKIGKSGTHKSSLSELEDDEVEFDQSRTRPITPTVGFTGHYRGKSDGKLGTSLLHHMPLSEWDEDSVLKSYGKNVYDSKLLLHSHSKASVPTDNDMAMSPVQMDFNDGSSSSPKLTLPLSPYSPDKINKAITLLHSNPSPHDVAIVPGSETTKMMDSSYPPESSNESKSPRNVFELNAVIRDSLIQTFHDPSKARSKLKKAFLQADKEKEGLIAKKQFHFALENWMNVELSPVELDGYCEEFRGETKRRLQYKVEYVSYVKFLNTVVPSMRSIQPVA